MIISRPEAILYSSNFRFLYSLSASYLAERGLSDRLREVSTGQVSNLTWRSTKEPSTAEVLMVAAVVMPKAVL